MTQDNVNVEVPISMDDIRTVLNRDAKFALQVQNAALNRAVAELSSQLDVSQLELSTVKEQLENSVCEDCFALEKAREGNKKGG